MTDNRAKIVKAKMCKDKVSFRNKANAQKIASKYGQHVYECPVCWCYLTTSKENWRLDFYTKSDLDRREMQVREKLNPLLKEQSKEIHDLKQKIIIMEKIIMLGTRPEALVVFKKLVKFADGDSMLVYEAMVKCQPSPTVKQLEDYITTNKKQEINDETTC